MMCVLVAFMMIPDARAAMRGEYYHSCWSFGDIVWIGDRFEVKKLTVCVCLLMVECFRILQSGGVLATSTWRTCMSMPFPFNPPLQ